MTVGIKATAGTACLYMYRWQQLNAIVQHRALIMMHQLYNYSVCKLIALYTLRRKLFQLQGCFTVEKNVDQNWSHDERYDKSMVYIIDPV